MLKSNIVEFNANIDAFAARVPEKAALLQKKMVLLALRGVVLKTPVLTGIARGGWQVSIDTPAIGQVGIADKEGNATIEKGLEAIANLPPYNIVFICNNVYYIIYLENGSSQKAPAGMVAVTLEELKNVFGS